MKLPSYHLKSNYSLMTFEFTSKGTKGEIQKIIQFQQTEIKELYNLAFGDKNLTTGEINDVIISNNGDLKQILATVLSSLNIFTDQYPQNWVYISGSTQSRTRLYQIGISLYIDEIEEIYLVWGNINDSWERFIKNKNYDGFLIKRK